MAEEQGGSIPYPRYIPKWPSWGPSATGEFVGTAVYPWDPPVSGTAGWLGPPVVLPQAVYSGEEEAEDDDGDDEAS